MKKLKICRILSNIVFILNLVFVIMLFIINIFPANLVYYRSIFMCSFILFSLLLLIYLILIIDKIKLKKLKDENTILIKKVYNKALIALSIEIIIIYIMFIVYLINY